MKEAIVPKIYNKEMIDRTIVVNTKDAYEWVLKLTRDEGIFVGQSSGAAMCAAHQVAREVENGVFVVIFPDLGFKYLTADPYMNEEIVEKIPEARRTGQVVRI